jgi:acyl carrier protein
MFNLTRVTTESSMKEKNLEDKVLSAVSLFTGIETTSLRREYFLSTDLGIDSITLWEIMTHLEVELGITDAPSYTEVSDEDFTSIKTIEHIIEYARRQTL